MPSPQPSKPPLARLVQGSKHPVAVYNELNGQPIGRTQLRPERDCVMFRIAWTLMLLAVSGANADEVHSRLNDRAVGLFDDGAGYATPAKFAGQCQTHGAGADNQNIGPHSLARRSTY